MTPETQQRIAEIEERERKATAGKWSVAGRPPSVVSNPFEPKTLICTGTDGSSMFGDPDNWEDMYFIACARQDIPWLLQLVEEQQKEIEGYKLAEEALISDAGKATQYNWMAAEYRDKAERLQTENQRYQEALEWLKSLYESDWTYEPGTGEVVEIIINKFEQVLAERSDKEESLGDKKPWKGKQHQSPIQTLSMKWNEFYILTNWSGRIRYAVAVWDDGTITYERLPDDERSNIR